MENAKRQFALIEEIASLRNELTRLCAPLNERIEAAMKELADLMRGGEKSKRPRRRGPRKTEDKDKEEGKKENKSGHILRLLGESPTAGYGEITVSLYGSDTSENRNKMRTLLYVLKAKGLVRPRPEGGWEAVR